MRRIRITGEITPQSAEIFLRDLESAAGDPIQILVNSEGGSVDAGLKMYAALVLYEGPTTAIVESLAASMASIVVLAADKVAMLPDALYMIHPPETMPGIMFGERDTADNLEARAEYLRKVEEDLCRIYLAASQGKLTEESLKALWAKEPYLSADQAIEYGFAQEKISSVPDAVSVSKVTLKGNAPKQLVRMVAQARKKSQMNEEQMKALRASLGLSETATAEEIQAAVSALKAEDAPPADPAAEPDEDEEFAEAVAKLPPNAQARVLALMSGTGESNEELLAKIPANLRAFASKLAPAALREFIKANSHSGARPSKTSTEGSSGTANSDDKLRSIAKAQSKAGLGREDEIFALLKKGAK